MKPIELPRDVALNASHTVRDKVISNVYATHVLLARLMVQRAVRDDTSKV